MTCVWQAILAGMSANMFECQKKPDPLTFVRALKLGNRKTRGMRVNGHLLRERELHENFEAVRDFQERSIHSGYYCSTSDPFLLLIADLYKLNIVHKYMQVTISYTNPEACRQIVVQSDAGHMSFVSASDL